MTRLRRAVVAGLPAIAISVFASMAIANPPASAAQAEPLPLGALVPGVATSTDADGSGNDGSGAGGNGYGGQGNGGSTASPDETPGRGNAGYGQTTPGEVPSGPSDTDVPSPSPSDSVPCCGVSPGGPEDEQPEGELPVTGAPAVALAVIGGLLAGGGVALRFAARRRRVIG